MSNKKTFTPYVPPDPTRLYMDLNTAIMNEPDGTHIALTKFKHYKSTLSIDVKGEISNIEVDVQQDYTTWAMANLYVPLTTEVRVYTNSTDPILKGRVGIVVPKKAFIGVEFLKLYPLELRERANEVALEQAEYWFDFKMDNNDEIFLLTDKNYKVIKELPKVNKKVDFSKLPF